MNLVSCDGCGLVYDKDKVKVVSDSKISEITHSGESLDGIAAWNDYDECFSPVIVCTCGEEVMIKKG